MFVILGAAGHVGSVVAQVLIDRGLPVMAVVRDDAQAVDWVKRGADAAVVDLHNSASLRRVFQRGTRAFLLNPPADVTLDTDAEEMETAASIVAALEGSGLEKVVLASTFGAQPGDRLGDLSVLYKFEQAARGKHFPVTIQRGAYCFSNWDVQLAEAKKGRLTTMFPPDLELPMVAPADLGHAAAAQLMEPFSGDTGVHLVEGPRRYCARDVAEVFATVLDRPVELVSLPPRDWIGAYRKLGFSASAAASYARMTHVTGDGQFPLPNDTEKGPTTLEAYVRDLVDRS